MFIVGIAFDLMQKIWFCSGPCTGRGPGCAGCNTRACLVVFRLRAARGVAGPVPGAVTQPYINSVHFLQLSRFHWCGYSLNSQQLAPTVGQDLNDLSTMGSKWDIEKFTGSKNFGLWK
ncbi:hypothetical protein A2U01_0028989, partial [Trifolium medium]|nr:hypothetical protein [Trifolium medium]